MKTKQLEDGDLAESSAESYFHKYGYWAYILPKKIGGQPFDLIACRKNDTWFVDVKHLERDKASFTFDRVEPNQWSSMMYAKKVADIENLGFVIMWERDLSDLYFLEYETAYKLKNDGIKSVKITEMRKLGELLNENYN